MKYDIKYFKIFARVDPETKSEVIIALQNINEVVLMTGDGFNDMAAISTAGNPCIFTVFQ